MSRIIIRHNKSGRILHVLDQADLRGVSLAGIDLTGAAMYAIENEEPDTHENPVAVLEFRRIGLSGADCKGAALAKAVFSQETIVGADFSAADLRNAVFVRTHFVRCSFGSADLTGARLGNSCFTSCHWLHRAKGLDTLEHIAPSSLDAGTMRDSVTKLPVVMLLGMGYTEQEISAFRVLYGKEKSFYSCFISYARADREFAGHLRMRLLKKSVSCWQDVYDMKGGALWRGQIYDAIEKHDKLILVCSRASLTRPAVVEEILETMDRPCLRHPHTDFISPVALRIVKGE